MIKSRKSCHCKYIWAPRPNLATRGSNMAWWRRVIPKSRVVSPFFWPIMDDLGFSRTDETPAAIFGVGRLRWKQNVHHLLNAKLFVSRCLSSNMLSTAEPAASGSKYLRPSLETKSIKKRSLQKNLPISYYTCIYILRGIKAKSQVEWPGDLQKNAERECPLQKMPKQTLHLLRRPAPPGWPWAALGRWSLAKVLPITQARKN